MVVEGGGGRDKDRLNNKRDTHRHRLGMTEQKTDRHEHKGPNWTKEHTHLLRMINDAGDLLCVTFEDGHDLLCVLVEDDSIFVVATSNNTSCVPQTDIKGKDAWHTGAVYTLSHAITHSTTHKTQTTVRGTFNANIHYVTQYNFSGVCQQHLLILFGGVTNNSLYQPKCTEHMQYFCTMNFLNPKLCDITSSMSMEKQTWHEKKRKEEAHTDRHRLGCVAFCISLELSARIQLYSSLYEFRAISKDLAVQHFV